MKYRNIILIIAVLIFFSVSIFIGITITTMNVIGANSSTTTTKVWVWNTEPDIRKVEISPTSIDLTAGNTTIVNCTAYVFDWNGWQDVNVTNATFYHKATSSNLDSDDKNYHYSNSSCASCSSQDDSSTNASCLCSFTIEYFAYNGTWICNMSISDNAGNATERLKIFNGTGNASVIINTLLAVDVPAEIDYGNLSVTETSKNKTANITNYGNIAINISVRGWGGDNVSIQNAGNQSMFCDLGNISIGYEKFTLDIAADYSSMHNLSGTSSPMNFTLPVRTSDNDYGNSTNTTYWKIKIPLTVGGSCNGTIEFSATDAS